MGSVPYENACCRGSAPLRSPVSRVLLELPQVELMQGVPLDSPVIQVDDHDGVGVHHVHLPCTKNMRERKKGRRNKTDARSRRSAPQNPQHLMPHTLAILVAGRCAAARCGSSPHGSPGSLGIQRPANAPTKPPAFQTHPPRPGCWTVPPPPPKRRTSHVVRCEALENHSGLVEKMSVDSTSRLLGKSSSASANSPSRKPQDEQREKPLQGEQGVDRGDRVGPWLSLFL